MHGTPHHQHKRKSQGQTEVHATQHQPVEQTPHHTNECKHTWSAAQCSAAGCGGCAAAASAPRCRTAYSTLARSRLRLFVETVVWWSVCSGWESGWVILGSTCFGWRDGGGGHWVDGWICVHIYRHIQNRPPIHSIECGGATFVRPTTPPWPSSNLSSADRSVRPVPGSGPARKSFTTCCWCSCWR